MNSMQVCFVQTVGIRVLVGSYSTGEVFFSRMTKKTVIYVLRDLIYIYCKRNIYHVCRYI